MSAAYLQALHAQDDGEEPVQESSSSVAQPVQAEARASTRQPDLESESAFPTLGGSGLGKGKKAAQNGALSTGHSPLWGNGKSPLLETPASRPDTPASAVSSQGNAPTPRAQYRDTLTLDSSSIQLAPPSTKPVRRGEEAQPTSLGDAAALIMKLNPNVRVDASTAKSSSTFLFVGPNEDAVRKARNDLLARIVKKVCLSGVSWPEVDSLIRLASFMRCLLPSKDILSAPKVNFMHFYRAQAHSLPRPHSKANHGPIRY
jgi:hypothetical protein